ncbi:MAG: hypothetical protein IJX47_06050 [Clostridia bacterium]|nr:hypothetical protein [Clostridia bacterium]
MKNNGKAVTITTYVAGIFAITSALLVMILLIMSAVGFLFPRKTKLILHTDTLVKTYDATPLTGGEPVITFGSLHYDHKLVTLSTDEYTNVGEYANEPLYMIVDASGADVTDLYDIHTDFGTIIIERCPITVYSPGMTKPYDGTPLVSGNIYISAGKLAKGHVFVSGSTTSITDPGSQSILPLYSIINEDGVDVTDQYRITDNLGTLTVLPVPIRIITHSASKIYDGKPLSLNEWEIGHGSVLEGHQLEVKCTTEVSEVGVYDNLANVTVYDDKKNNVSYLYDISIIHGNLEISPISLHITTGSLTKEYDGTSLSCTTWTLDSGKLGEGESISVINSAVLNTVGNASNHMTFAVHDKKGNDITSRYAISYAPGQLRITPRSVTIRTGSATKVYDGLPLVCDEYEIIKGSLCPDETLDLAFTSIVNIGYSNNYVIDCSILKKDQNGNTVNVSGNYVISYDYGILKITPQ